MNTKTLTLELANGEKQDITIRPIQLEHFQTAFSKSADELDFTAFSCGKIKAWVLALAPESYDELHKAVEELNPSFFSFAQRQQEKQNAQNRAMFEALADMPPETLKSLAQVGVPGSKETAPLPQPMRPNR